MRHELLQQLKEWTGGPEDPSSLMRLYFEWQKEHPEIEIVIASGLADYSSSYASRAWLKEGLRLTHFGTYLTQITFSKACSRVAYPPVRIGQIDKIAVTVVEKDRPVEILLGSEALLGKSDLYSYEGVVEVISTAVEEYSHWVRGLLMWKNPEGETKLRHDFDIYNAALDEKDAVGAEIDYLNNFSWSEILENCTPAMCDAYSKDLERRSLAAHIRYLATPDEFMGIIWQKKVCKLFFPWSKMTKHLQEEYDRAYRYKLSSSARQR